jgi:hypothetical protein
MPSAGLKRIPHSRPLLIYEYNNSRTRLKKQQPLDFLVLTNPYYKTEMAFSTDSLGINPVRTGPFNQRRS